MNDSNIGNKPKILSIIEQKSAEIGFTMPSDIYIGTLLKTLISSKPNGKFLELGTGIGLSLAWMLDGMDENSTLTTVDNDQKLIDIANENFGEDHRLKIICADGAKWIKEYNGDKFDLIFADAWPGKYTELEETLDMLKIGGFYIIDDMIVQPNWPKGHQDNVDQLIKDLEDRKNLTLTKINWSTGLLVAVKNQ